MIKYAYFIINKLVMLFLKLLFGQPKLLAVTKLMAFFFFFGRNLSICSNSEIVLCYGRKRQRLQQSPNSDPRGPLSFVEIHQGPGPIQVKQFSVLFL